MSLSALHVFPGSTVVAEKKVLSPEAENALLTRARNIIAGRLQPPELSTTPEIENFLKREYGEMVPPPTPEAIRMITETLKLQVHYRGESVAYCRTPLGDMAVLAAGEAEIVALLRSLAPSERPRVVVTDTDPY